MCAGHSYFLLLFVDPFATQLSGSSQQCHGYVGSDGEQHVNFIGADGHVRELFYRPGEGWVNNSLTQLAGSTVLPSGDSGLAGYARADGDQHVLLAGRVRG